ncbi:hypothetical protein [Mesoaciditoga sp.]
MRKGQLSILVVGILIAVTIATMGFFARNQVDELELQQIGIESVATSTYFANDPATQLNLKK